MATSLSAQLRASINATFTDDQDLGDPSVQIALSALESLANGTSNVQADKIFSDTRTIALSSSEVLDFGTAGGLLDAFGDAFEPAEIMAVLAVADSANTNNVIFGANGTEDWFGPMGAATHTTIVKPDGWLFWFAPAGWAVTNNSADKLKVANSGAGTGVTYSIIILARSA